MATTTFSFTGTTQNYTVPAGVFFLLLEAWGAQGGTSGAKTGGLGGYSKCLYPVTPGQVVYVYVGGQPADSSAGFNGGGASSAAKGGGGWSGFRLGSESNDPILIAAGGGGAGLVGTVGGNGGGLTGSAGTGTGAGGGASQTAGGSGGLVSASALQGAAGYGGGGGGGLFGGGGGYNPSNPTNSGSGGGGSSGFGPSAIGSTTTAGQRSGNGFAQITPNQPPSATGFSLTPSIVETNSSVVGSWTYADAESDPQTQYKFRYSPTGANTWTELAPVTSSSNTGAFSTAGLSVQVYDVQVAVSDGVAGFGAWSNTATLNVSNPVPQTVNAVSPGMRLSAPTGIIVGVGQAIFVVSAGLGLSGTGPGLAPSVGAVSPGMGMGMPLQGMGPGVAAPSPGIGLHNGGPLTIYWNGLFAAAGGLGMGATGPDLTIYIRPATPTYTVDEYRAKYFDPQVTVTRRVEILEANGSTLWEGGGTDPRLVTGAVSIDYTRDERRSLDLELSNFDKKLAHKPDGFWYDKFIRVYRGIQFYDKSGLRTHEVALGKFLMDQITYTRMPSTVKVTARDQTKKCLLSKFTQSVVFVAGTKITDIVSALAANAGCTDQIIPNSDEVLGTDTSFDRGVSRWEAMKQVADSFAYELFFDANGYLVMRKYLDPTTSPISYEFTTGLTGTLIDWTEVADDTQLFNHVSVGGKDPNDIPIIADAYNTDPNSPTNIDTIGDRVYTFDSDMITTLAQAQELADSLLAVNGLEEFTINLSSLVAPWLEVGEIIKCTRPDLDPSEPDRFLLTQLGIPLGLEPMSATGRRILIAS